MLGILMGILAWVVDAWVSWQFFPGSRFYDLLMEHDPGRTLYVRSIVTGLFFIFGLVAGRLVARTEQSEARERAHVVLLNAVRHVHRILVEETEPQTLIQRVCEVMSSHLSNQGSTIILLDPETHHITHVATSGAQGPLIPVAVGCKRDQLPVALLQTLDHKGALSPDRAATSALLPGENPHPLFLCCRLSFRDRVFGALCLPAPIPVIQGPAGLLFFQEMCDDLGHALARLADAAALRDHQEKLQSLYEHAPVGIFVSTFSGRYIFCNPQMAESFGYPPDVDIETLSVGDLYEDPARRADLLRELREKGEVAHFEARFKRRDGEVFWLRLAARRTGRHQDGDEIIEGFAMDISNAKTAEAERSALQNRLHQSQKFESIASLAGGIAHEFNNILQAMMGSAYLAQLQAPEGSPAWQYLRDIQQSGSRAAQLCDQMLTYAGKKALRLRRLAADELVKTLMPVCENQLPDTTQVVWNLSYPEAMIRAEATSLKQMIIQLILNASESLAEGRGEVRISTRAAQLYSPELQHLLPPAKRESGLYWILEVADNGSGIAEESIHRIFDPFFSTKFPGRGLGLSAVQGIVQSFGGGISVQSRVGVGSTFRVVIPLSPEPAPNSATPGESPAKSKTAIFRGQGRLWIVDDEPLICQTTARVLTAWGFDVRTFTDGSEAVEALRASSEPPQLLLLDVTMPRLSGPETLRRMRDISPELRTVVMSGFDEEESLRHFEGLETDHFIHKPFQVEQLQDLLSRILPQGGGGVEGLKV